MFVKSCCLLFVAAHTNANKKNKTQKAILAPKACNLAVCHQLFSSPAVCLMPSSWGQQPWQIFYISPVFDAWKVCDFTTRAMCLCFLRSPPMLRDVPPRAFMFSSHARIKQASAVGSCVCECGRTTASHVPVTILLYPSLMCHLDGCCGVKTMEQRNTPLSLSFSLSNYPLSIYILGRACERVWQWWWSGGNAHVVKMTQMQRTSQWRLIYKQIFTFFFTLKSNSGNLLPYLK